MGERIFALYCVCIYGWIAKWLYRSILICESPISLGLLKQSSWVFQIRLVDLEISNEQGLKSQFWLPFIYRKRPLEPFSLSPFKRWKWANFRWIVYTFWIWNSLVITSQFLLYFSPDIQLLLEHLSRELKNHWVCGLLEFFLNFPGQSGIPQLVYIYIYNGLQKNLEQIFSLN